MKCVVCLTLRAKSREAGAASGWVSTSERVAMANIQLLFKLYEVTKREFPHGAVCPDCFHLAERADSLEFQAGEVQRALRARVRDDGDDEEEDAGRGDDGDEEFVVDEEEGAGSDGDSVCEVAAVARRAHKRRRRRKRSWKAKVKREKPDAEPDDADATLTSIAAAPGTTEGDAQHRLDVSSYLKVEHSIKNENPEQEEGKPSAAPQLSKELDEQQRHDGSVAGREKSKSNFDFRVTLTRTTRGQEQLVYEGFTYLKAHLAGSTTVPGGDVARWKCSHYYAAKSSCPAKLSTTLDGACVLLDSLTAGGHNHPAPGGGHLRVLLFREQVRQIVANHPEMRTADILGNARALQTEEGDSAESLGIKDESLVRFIQRCRNRTRQKRQDRNQSEQSQAHCASLPPQQSQPVLPVIVPSGPAVPVVIQVEHR